MMPHNPWGSSARRPCARWHPPAIRGPVPFLPGTNHVHASTGSARTEPRPRHHTKVRIQPRNAPTQPFDRSITKRHPHRSPGASRYTKPFAGASQNANHTVRLELVERWTGTPQLVPIRSYFDRLSTNGATASSPHEISHSASQCPYSTVRPEHHKKPFAILTVRLEPHETPTLPFALSLSKGGRELRNSYPFARTSTGSARTEPRPLHHTKVCIQRRNAPTQPFAWSIKKRHPHRSPGASRYTNLTVRLELVERWTGTPQLAPIRSYFDGLSTNGVSDFSGTLNGDVNFRSRGDRTREDTDYYVPRYRSVPRSQQSSNAGTLRAARRSCPRTGFPVHQLRRLGSMVVAGRKSAGAADHVRFRPSHEVHAPRGLAGAPALRVRGESFHQYRSDG